MESPAIQTRDLVRTYRAFVDKRPPVFRGR